MEELTPDHQRRIARFRGHVEHQLAAAVRLALGQLDAEGWRRLHRASLYGGRVWLRAEMGPDGLSAALLCGWETSEPDELVRMRVSGSEGRDAVEH